MTNSRSWTVLDLAELAVKADAVEVLHILVDYCSAELLCIIIFMSTCTLNQLIIVIEL